MTRRLPADRAATPDAVITINGPWRGSGTERGSRSACLGSAGRRRCAGRRSAPPRSGGASRPLTWRSSRGALLDDPSRLVDRELEVTASGPDGHPFAGELTVARAGVDSALFIVWIRDISERRAEEADAARRFVMLGHSEEIAGIGSWDWDIRTGELRWSDNLFRLFGFSPGAITPTPERAIERIHRDDRDRVRQLVETAVATGETRTGRIRNRARGRRGAARAIHRRVGRAGAWRHAPVPRNVAGCDRAAPDRSGDRGAHRDRGGSRGVGFTGGRVRAASRPRSGRRWSSPSVFCGSRRDDVLVPRSIWRLWLGRGVGARDGRATSRDSAGASPGRRGVALASACPRRQPARGAGLSGSGRRSRCRSARRGRAPGSERRPHIRCSGVLLTRHAPAHRDAAALAHWHGT